LTTLPPLLALPFKKRKRLKKIYLRKSQEGLGGIAEGPSGRNTLEARMGKILRKKRN
jgi:hypothetical protein